MEASRIQVISCVEAGLLDVLGPNGSAAIVYHLGQRGVLIADSFDQPTKFVKGLNLIFGVGGAMLENRFTECVRYHFDIDAKHRAFADVVDRVRRG